MHGQSRDIVEECEKKLQVLREEKKKARRESEHGKGREGEK